MERNAFFDNAKVLLIFLVVFGHMIQPFTSESHIVNTLYLWIYTFHMPAFILLSGFFAKGASDKGYIAKLAKKLLVPYLIFQILYTLFYFWIGKEGWNTGIFYPQWSLWFLFSLFSWHILLIGFKKLAPQYGISLAVLIGLLVGYIGDIGHTFSLSRTLVFFPFFLIGYWLTQKQILMVKRPAVKLVSIFILIGVGISLAIAPDLNSGWLLASKSYVDLGLVELGGLARLLVYLTAALMTVSILAWVPQQNFGWVTDIGRKTLYVYLLHGFFIQWFREKNLFDVSNVLDITGLAVLSALIVILLSSNPIRLISQPIIECKASLLKKRWQENHSQHQL
ncbi:hypothetical protein D8M04_14925 [Oceanobacillus piezotolerans]|uniref:Acyltransferase 3 domain-containing protein n=1 Tax=Oceanobacillus piezotolerans TaxID=2448030 RepID=A0A498D612_9BACI|nr:acyltransferase family protein [Oceanobacillus piezotolerans]RLL42840.1 hypothetical protein D8M04_14925 [Oceanobacillus piezotolerans]